jgi:hypothetical protein
MLLRHDTHKHKSDCVSRNRTCIAIRKQDIVIDFFLNNQPDALIIAILFCYKILRVSGISSAHHQEFSTVRSALASFMHFLMTVYKQSQDGTVLHPDSAWKQSSETCMEFTSAECAVENS